MNTRKRVLIVSADPGFRRLRDDLESPEVEAATAVDERAARESLARARPDLVLVDLDAEPADGIGFLERLRLQGDIIPILAATARVASAVEAMRLGVVGCLDKPLDARKVRLALGKAHPRLSPAPSGPSRHLNSLVSEARTALRRRRLDEAAALLILAAVESPASPEVRALREALQAHRGRDQGGYRILRAWV